eukprot:5590253-Pyramimonas_sp.AAC.1
MFASCGPLETLLRGLFGRLGGVCGRLEAILGVLDRSVGDLEPSWTVLGLGDSWGPLGALCDA